MSVTGIVLAAGGSTRLGTPKQLLDFRGGTLLGEVLRVVRTCGLDQLIVALGGAAGEVERVVDLNGVVVVHNPDFGTGCASSIARALGAVDPGADGAVLFLGDQPGIDPAAVAQLVARGPGDGAAVCRYRNGRGHPIFFARAVFDELRTLHGDKGVWRLLGSGRIPVVEVPVDAETPLDVDTWDDYRRLRELDAGRSGGAFADVADVAVRFDDQDYLLDEGTASAIFLATELGRPLLLEGEPGVGKTTAAKALAAVLGTDLIRLQCYDGLGAAEALYDWNFQRQMLAIRLAQDRAGQDRAGQDRTAPLRADDLFTEEFLLERPVLRCVRHGAGPPPVLLVDEIDRADDEFEALLLEFLGEWSVTIPELGTFVAATPPRVVLTSNRSRDLHDALRRRCLYHWIDFPDPDRAAAILRRLVPAANTALIGSVVRFVGEVRRLDLDKPPGVAEAIDWVAALAALGAADLARPAAVAGVGAIAKTPDDRTAVLDLLLDMPEHGEREEGSAP